MEIDAETLSGTLITLSRTVGGIVGTIADSEDYSVNMTDCAFENAEQEIGDWIPHNR